VSRESLLGRRSERSFHFPRCHLDQHIDRRVFHFQTVGLGALHNFVERRGTLIGSGLQRPRFGDRRQNDLAIRPDQRFRYYRKIMRGLGAKQFHEYIADERFDVRISMIRSLALRQDSTIGKTVRTAIKVEILPVAQADPKNSSCGFVAVGEMEKTFTLAGADNDATLLVSIPANFRVGRFG
jgi:hypothetical protein